MELNTHFNNHGVSVITRESPVEPVATTAEVFDFAYEYFEFECLRPV